MKAQIPDILLIGHACHDLVDGAHELGGAVSFGSLLATKLDKKAGIVTSTGNDFDFYDFFIEHQIVFECKLARATTVFENKYSGKFRTQYLYDRADMIYAKDIPEEWLPTPAVLFCPIADELDPAVFPAFPNALRGLTLQGCLRQWDANGLISPKAMDWDLLDIVDVVFLSDDDLAGMEEAFTTIKTKAHIVILTHGAAGATIYCKGNDTEFHLPAYPANEIDPTGAGDAFATAFLLKYAETIDLKEAGIFAHAAASLMIEAQGFNDDMDLEMVQERVEAYRVRFS